MKIWQLIEFVKIRANEYSPYPIKGADDVTRHYVRNLLPEAYRSVVRTAPREELPCKTYETDTEGDTPVIKMPEKFDRIARVITDAWDYPVAEVSGVGTVQYELQGNEYSRGTTDKPVVIELSDEKIRLFSLGDGNHHVETEYMPKLIFPDDNTCIDFLPEGSAIVEQIVIETTKRLLEIYATK